MICAEFHCRPSQAIAELRRMPVGFLEDVIMARRYVEAYYANEYDEKGWDRTPLRRLAKEIAHELAAEAIAQAEEDQDG